MTTYKNISSVTQLDIEPGQTGERDIPKDQEDRMVERGAIEVVGSGSASTTDEVDQPPEAEQPGGGKGRIGRS